MSEDRIRHLQTSSGMFPGILSVPFHNYRHSCLFSRTISQVAVLRDIHWTNLSQPSRLSFSYNPFSFSLLRLSPVGRIHWYCTKRSPRCPQKQKKSCEKMFPSFHNSLFADDPAFYPCVRRFELPTFWSVAKRSIQLS